MHKVTALAALAAGALVAACQSTSAPKSFSLAEEVRRPGAVLPVAATQLGGGQIVPAASAVHAHPAEIPLWSGTAPGTTLTTPEVVEWRTEKDSVTGESFCFPTVTNIHVPSITPYLPAKGNATGACVIIAPGGGHWFLTINHEGYDLAKYLAERGIAAIVLKYRLPRAFSYPAGTYTVEKTVLADSQRAVRQVRAHAAEWGINPNAIGVIGFSAGGDIVAQLHLHPDDGDAASADPVERQPCKVNFEAPVYTGSFRPITPAAGSPPLFMAVSSDDGSAAGMVDVYLKYKAAGIPAEVHVYSMGGHGFGARDRPIAEAQWPEHFIAWLNDRGLTKK